MERDQHLEETENPLAFLSRLDVDPQLAERCEQTDLPGRLDIAAELGLAFTEEHLRRTIRSWDFHGTWRRWLEPGRLTDGVERWPEVVDDLPALTREHPIGDEQRAAYARDGYVVLREVMSADEIRACRPVFSAALAQFNSQTASTTDSAEHRALLQIINTRTRSAALRHVVLARRFAKIAADLLGVAAVRVYFDQMLYKEPRSFISHWHQDHTYFPLQTDDVVTIWIPLVDVTADMGVLVYAPGSHRLGDLGSKPDYEEAQTELPAFVRERGYHSVTTGPMAAGDATMHSGWVLHGALANRSPRMREAISITYYPDGTRLAEPNNEYQRRALALGFPGMSPGDPAAAAITPIAYRADG